MKVLYLLYLCLAFICIENLAHAVPPACSAEAYCIIDQSGNKVKAKNEMLHKPPASTIKLLTAMIVLDSHIPLSQEITASPSVKGIVKSHVPIHPGDVFTCESLLRVMLVHSANDAAVVLAEAVGKSIAKFAELMNEKARKIGCQNSNFVNPHGLDAKKQYSCAYDLALLAREAYKYTKIREILATSRIEIKSKAGSVFSCKSGNQLLGEDPQVFGKTGYTDRSRNTFAGFCTQNGQVFFVGLINTHKRTRMWADLMLLLEIRPKIDITNPENLVNNTRNVQNFLAMLGYYSGEVDGLSGPQTKFAIKMFQQDQKLKTDGIVGPQTWKAIVESVTKFQQKKPTTLPPPVPPRPDASQTPIK